MAYIRGFDHDQLAPPVQLDRVTIQYNGNAVLQEVSFALEAGEQIAVVGPNGAGKTTLFRAIAGTLEPTSGTVRVYGHGPGGHICIAYVPQRSEVDWKFPATVQDVVMMGRIQKIGLLRWPRKRDWQFVRRSLKRVGVSELAGEQIGDLSGGQQQRVFMAQALAQEAELLLLDEPLTGLDLPSQEAIFEILQDLKRQNVTVLMATHDLNLAADRFDRVMLLNKRVVAYGSPAQAFTQENLLDAYGGHVHVLEGDGRLMVLTDSCCEDEDHHPHD